MRAASVNAWTAGWRWPYCFSRIESRKQVFEDALTQTGTPRFFDRPCLHYVVCPHQFVWPICALASFMLPTSNSARCISRFDATTLWHLDAAEWAPSTASFATD